MRTIQDMVQQEVICCVSSLVSTIASGYGTLRMMGNDLPGLCEQAYELTTPVPDYEEAAIQHGFERRGSIIVWNENVDEDISFSSWREACEENDIDPYDREVFEHWAVSDWFARKLEDAGEKVDRDFAGLCVWARTTTGQAIHADGVIECIYAETHRVEA